MINSKTQKNVIKCLPPSFQSLSSFQFGKLIIELNIQQLKEFNVKDIRFEFMGGFSQIYDSNKNKKVFQFAIKTTLWHFYQYLKDMDQIKLLLVCEDSTELHCKRKIQLLSAQKVFNHSFLKGNYIANSVQLCDIFDNTNQNKGYTMVKVKLQFDQQIHNQIVQIVNFESLFNNPEENNKQSVPNYQNNNGFTDRKAKDSYTAKNQYLNKNQPINNQSHRNKQNQLNIQNVFSTLEYQNKKNTDIQQSRMLEDDIDRMIAEMQNKPYDSSRYLDNPPTNSFSHTANLQKINWNNQRQNLHFTHQAPAYNNMGYNTSGYQQSNIEQHKIDNFNYSRTSKSPLRKYPDIPLPNKSHHQMKNPQVGNTTIFSQRSLSPGLSSRKRSLNRTQQLPYQSSMKNLTQYSGSRVSQNHQTNKGGCLKIQIHQLLGRSLEDDQGLVLNVYINNQYQQIISCKGLLQGEVILYNQKTEVNQCILSQIQKIRFQLINWQNQILYSLEFQMNRLLNIPKLEGIFMLNFHPHSQQFYGSTITASQTILKKLQKAPSQRTLRISISFIQELQVIQMYLNLSKFSLDFCKCKYKIPFTKQTVQFQPTQAHFNIFPHSKSYPKLMIQFWTQKSIIGASQISLSNIKNITKNILQCNIQPIYLYDCMFPIKNLFNQNQIGKFKLLVCCGNVRQIQHVLNKSMLTRTQSLNQNVVNTKEPVQVQYNKKLGVFIKDRKANHEIQIQVDQKEFQGGSFGHKQNQQKNNQISMLSQNQFLSSKAINDNQLPLSKIHSLKLNQQQQIDDSSDQNQNQQHHQNSNKNGKIEQNKHKKKKPQPSSKQQYPSQLKSTKGASKQPSKPVLAKPSQPVKQLISLSKLICNKIQQSFIPLSQNRFKFFEQLKLLCKPHLLFNFVDIDILIKYMIQLGISKVFINKTLQMLQPTNGMINFNLFNDFMISLRLEGQIKENLIPDKLFVKFMLKQYYNKSCQNIQHQQLAQKNSQEIMYVESQKDKQKDLSKWLGKKYLGQISTLDQSIDFNQMKKLFAQLDLKISMNQYNIIKKFLEDENQIKSYLFQLSQSNHHYEQIIKAQNNIYETLKLSVIQDVIKNKRQQVLSKKYQENILKKLYQSHVFSERQQTSQISQFDEKSISSSRIHENQNDEFNLKQNVSFAKNQSNYNNFNQTVQTYPKKQYVSTTKFNKERNSSTNNSNIRCNKQQEYQDEEDFIINGLNKNDTNRQVQQKQKKNSYFDNQIKEKQELNYAFEQQTYIDTKRYKQKTPQVVVNNGDTTINYSVNRTITVDGLESCRATCQCQLDKQLTSPYFKVIIEKPYQKKLYFKQSDKSSTQQFEIKVNSQSQEDQQIQGQVILNELDDKGQIAVAAVRFVVIKGIKSVYAMKTFEEQSFCGLINILVE